MHQTRIPLPDHFDLLSPEQQAQLALDAQLDLERVHEQLLADTRTDSPKFTWDPRQGWMPRHP